MAGGITFRVEGLKELEQGLMRLQGRIATQIGRRVLREAGKIVLEDTLRFVPVLTGALRASIRMKAGRKRQNFISQLVETAAGLFKGKTYYGGFVEFGHSKASRKQRERWRSQRRTEDGSKKKWAAMNLEEAEFGSMRVPAQSFIRRGLASAKGTVLALIEGGLRNELEKRL